MVFGLLDRRAEATYELFSALQPVRDMVGGLITIYGVLQDRGTFDGQRGRPGLGLVVEGLRNVGDREIFTAVKFFAEPDTDGSVDTNTATFHVMVESGGQMVRYVISSDPGDSYSEMGSDTRGPETCEELDRQFLDWVVEHLPTGR